MEETRKRYKYNALIVFYISPIEKKKKDFFSFSLLLPFNIYAANTCVELQNANT